MVRGSASSRAAQGGIRSHRCLGLFTGPARFLRWLSALRSSGREKAERELPHGARIGTVSAGSKMGDSFLRRQAAKGKKRHDMVDSRRQGAQQAAIAHRQAATFSRSLACWRPCSVRFPAKLFARLRSGAVLRMAIKAAIGSRLEIVMTTVGREGSSSALGSSHHILAQPAPTRGRTENSPSRRLQSSRPFNSCSED